MSNKLITITATVVLALAGLTACGGSPADVTPAPVTVTKTVPTTPAACLDALDKADTALTTAGDGFNVVAEILTAASNMDPDTMGTATDKLQGLSTKLTGELDAYKTARDACKGQ